MDEPDKHDVSQVVKVNITVISHADSMGPEWVVAKTVFYLCELPPAKSITPGWFWEKLTDKPHWEFILQNI